MRSEFGLADLIHAFTVLEADSESAQREIAVLLGIGWRGSQTDQVLDKLSEESIQTLEQEEAEEEELKQESIDEETDITGSEPESPPNIDSKPFDESEFPPELEPLAAGEPNWLVVPKWLPSRVLPLSTEEKRPRPPVMEPLLSPLRTRAILTESLATGVRDGPIDLETLEQRICEGLAITELPLLSRRSLGFGVEVLVDRARSMTPYFNDQKLIVKQIQSLFGSESTEIRYFAGSPIAGAGKGGRKKWRRWSPGTEKRPVLLLTDLGLRDAISEFTADWGIFTHTAKQAGCQVLALVPYPPDRWPPYCSDLFPILQWDRMTTQSGVRRTLGRRWSITG